MEGGVRPGTVLLEKYRVESVLGRGGMGVVLRVTHLHLGEELAMKILSPEAGGGPEVYARFLREAQSAIRLRSEHVARVGDVGMLPGGAPYMVMEYLRGGDLSGELARRGALPPEEVVDYLLQACEALAEAHGLGIVHRDIKPSNLFLTQRPDGSPLVKVLDFGISKAPISGPGVLTKTDTVMGTPGYMSPEQMKASKDVDARSDIWALGIVLYECLNGRRPFDAETFSATVLRAATEPPPPMDPRIPRGLHAVVLRCLEKDRRARFPSIAALAAGLAPFARDARSAGIVVERTAAMAKGRSAPVVQASSDAQSSTATTLSASAGMVRARLNRRRYAIGGVAVALTAFVAAAIVAVTASRGNHDIARSSELGTMRSGSAAVPRGADPPLDAIEVAAVPDSAVVAMPVEAVADAAAAPNPAEVDAQRKAKACAELEADQQWQELRDCANELATLGVRDKNVQAKAEEFRGKAVNEADSALVAGKLTAAIAEGNLREAQKQLKLIRPDSIYFSPATEAFRIAEAHVVEGSRHKAQALVATNDCDGVRRLQAQLNASATTAVLGAVAVVAAKCMDWALPQSGDPEVGATVDGNARPSAVNNPCDTPKIEVVMSQAQNQYTAGLAKVALQLMSKALACKQDAQMYRYAATYACAAHDLGAAKLYYGKVPALFQTAIVQRCQMEGLNLGGSTLNEQSQQLPQPQEPHRTQSDVQNACDEMDVEAVLAQATKQSKLSSASSALALLGRALACSQDIRLLQMAAAYACDAHYPTTAQRYYSMLPPTLQPTIKDRCAQSHITLVPN